MQLRDPKLFGGSILLRLHPIPFQPLLPLIIGHFLNLEHCIRARELELYA